MISANQKSVKRERLAFGLAIICLSPLFYVAAVNIVSTQNNHDSDFFQFWLAGKMNWTNQNPYDSEQWIDAHHFYGARWIPEPAYLYPLYSMLFFAPLGLIAFEQAYIIWVFLSQIFLLISIFLSTSLLIENPKRIHLLLPLVSGAFLFRPTLVTLRNGQMGAFFLLLLTLTLYLWKNSKWWQGGILISLLLIKPTIGIPVIGLAFLWLLSRKRVTALLAILVTVVLLICFGWILDPSWISQFLANGAQKYSDTIGYSPTFWGISGNLCHQRSECRLWVGGIFSLLFTGGTAIFLILKTTERSSSVVMSLVIPTALCITPYLWVYDQILLILPISIGMQLMLKLRICYIWAGLTPLVITILSLGLIYAALSLGNDALSVAVPMICYTVVLLKYNQLTNRYKWDFTT